MTRFYRVELAICAFCAISASDLFSTWFTSPFERYGWLIFGVWLTAGFLYSRIDRPIERSSPLVLPFLSLVLATLGNLGSLNTARYWALALSISGFFAWNWKFLPWILSAILWMPMMGWVESHGFSFLNTVGRMMLLLTTIFSTVFLMKISPSR